uniref:NADH-ubiquinone oxidoreductase chain 2 n=1 Tax=Scaphoideus nigrivalveus TaxID=2021108 RepID=A0A343ETC3_9HEMI|nr:NADH dehydrogenase subunit 2 [Scaphoideus nigrivalveus]
MYFNSTKLLLANTMMIGVIMTICSNNWVSMWMGLELSLLSFIPFMQTSNVISSESMMKYFIMQSVASTMLLFSVVIMLIGVSMMNEMIMTVSMLIKLGSAPFHNWVLLIIETMDYLVMFTMFTVLKMPPLSIMYQINSKMLIMPILLGMIVGSIFCLNQSSIRKTLAYSSIYNMGLMLTSVSNLNITFTYLMIYSISLLMLISIIKYLKVNFINQIMSNEYNNLLKINLWMNMLSMGGFPPLIGFMGKLLIIQFMLNNKEMIMTMILLTTSMLVTAFYTRMAFTSMISFSTLKKWDNLMNYTGFFITTLNLTLTPMMISFTLIC